ncbi:DUF1028 domain-containing protein [Pseudomonas typographi]|uniref:DUF1028 domain-containing protein n=1 Tax=Pseudomonas typographi TaxID=2715964 RepID=A0ABR7Z2Z3_9PSED|nr:DUF1028 domain-containing protein [Pseudomonas typographi]MBD1550228.1 DUF1028 domain-containing protein [Pseudomonas typographi]MBD1586012.1 DUF1028 domain-containing protein [Pseudomonas typographi]MBD1599870.1 DUF1028 domain-containing protein [Pseudomonas typographi]
MTFSLVARCASTGMLGVAVCSSSPAVAARCAYARAGIGAVLTQNFTDPSLGERGLELMSLGASATQAIEILARTASDPAYRQLAAIGPLGAPATHTGGLCLQATASAIGIDCAAVGNWLAAGDIAQRMVEAFTASQGHLAHRLLIAMRAGLEAGGEIEAVHSAGLKVMHEQPWPIADLRIDWTEACPITELEGLWALWEPRMPLYLARALQPAAAPAEDLA